MTQRAPAGKVAPRARGPKSALTITFGDCAENHRGMQKIGEVAAAGLEAADLEAARAAFEAAGCVCELLDLYALGGDAVAEAAGDDAAAGAPRVLVVRGGVAALLGAAGSAEDLYQEHRALAFDTKAWMYGRVVNKHARHNLCVADAPQEPDYEAGRGRVVAFSALPLTAALRAALPAHFGPKTRDLYAEDNLYYDVGKCGIGFHGDTERRIVVAARLGAPIPLHYQWFHRRAPVGERIVLELAGGDLYAMSAKAVGYDWKRSTVPTLRHAAGAAKFLEISP